MSPIEAVKLASLPAGFMLISTIAGLHIRVPETLAGALQHFAAGILLCTIGTELLPTMSAASGFQMNLACFFGFFAGVGVMLTLGVLFSEDHDDEDEEGNTGRRESVLKRSIASRQQKSNIVGESQSLLSKQSMIVIFPTGLLFAIAVDSLMDGLLIGIAMAAGPSAGPMMAASLSVEMGFLGLTLSMALNGQKKLKSAFVAMTGPAFIIIGSGIGGLLSHSFSNNPVSLA